MLSSSLIHEARWASADGVLRSSTKQRSTSNTFRETLTAATDDSQEAKISSSGRNTSQISATTSELPSSVTLSLDPNPFNPTGGMHTRAESKSSPDSKVPVTAPGSYGVVVAGPGQSYLPFEVSCLSGATPDGGYYPADYVDFESAQKLAEYTGLDGAKVVISCGGGFPGQAFPGSYGIQLPDGKVLDAGGLANLYGKYPKDYADLRIQQALEKARPVQLGSTFYAVDEQGSPLYSGVES